MKLNNTKPIAAVLIAFSTLAAISGTSKAQSSDKYFCGTSEDGVPTTFAQTVTGNQIPIIRWEKEWNEKFTPQARCEIVSENFQTAYEEGNLNYLVVGTKNDQSTICASRIYGEIPLNENKECKYHLFTLRNEDDPNEIVNNLETMGYRSSGALIQSNGFTWHHVQVRPNLSSSLGSN